MAEMKPTEMTISLKSLHKGSPEFSACKVADKRVTDLISDCTKLKLTKYLDTLVQLKAEINIMYAQSAKEERTKIVRELNETGEV